MFQPETEDMLPRMAPKPSAAVPSGEAILRPQVPEVSILFGQSDGNVLPQQAGNGVAQQQQFKNNTAQPSYAAWKKQMLPKVNYTPAAINLAEMQLPENGMPDYNTPRANLYPLRTSTSPVVNMAPNVAANCFAQTVSGQTNALTYRRSLDSPNGNNMMYPQHMQLMPTQPPLQTIKPSSRDVLTICAGTQTDASLDSPNTYKQSGPWSNLASKQDVDEVRLMLEEMRQDHQRIVKMLETLLLNPGTQFAMKPQSRDIGVQADSVENDNRPFTNGDVIANKQEQFDIPPAAAPHNKFLQHLKPSSNILQTPKGKPMAQSTTYRPNSPQSLRFQSEQLQEVASAPTYQQVSSKPPPMLHKSDSDTSLAMNELALKYLPNEKLAELLNELNMECPLTAGSVANNNLQPKTPVRGSGDKFEKGPSDISNASYKYLKKYRLLPEEHAEDVEGVDAGLEGEMPVNVNENQMPIYNSPQQQQQQQSYNNIRHNTPLNQRHTPTNKCSPYAGRLPLSPLARGVGTPPLQSAAVTVQHLVNLENIKQQPKFL